MSQLTIYLDEDTARRLEAAAKRDGVSVSRWARNHLKAALDRGWPREFFDLFGSVSESDHFQRPDELPWKNDVTRHDL